MIPFPHIDHEKLANTKLQLGRLTELPAGYLDLLELEDYSSLFPRLLKELRKRIFYILTVPTSLALDVVSNLCACLYQFVQVMINSDRAQEKAIENLQDHAFLFSKSLFALMASFLGLVEPTWITYFFNPSREKDQVAHSGGEINHQTLTTLYPKDKDELQTIVQSAIEKGQKICIRGAGFSQGEQYLSGTHDSLLLDLRHLDAFTVNEEEKSVTASAGCRWAEIQTALNKQKLALKVMQASNIFSVAGSLSTNIHGWDHNSGTLSQTVNWIEIINSQGELQKLTPQDEQFHAVCGGFGLFGIITRVNFKVQDNVPIVEKAREVAPSKFSDFFDENIKGKDDVRLFRYRLSIEPGKLLEQGLFSYYKTDPENPSPVVTEDFRQEGPIGTRTDRVFANAGKHWNWVRQNYWKNEVKELSDIDRKTSINAAMQPEMNAMFNNSVSESEWLQEYFIPQENLEAFRIELAKILNEHNVPLINCSYRYVKENPDGLLSYAPEPRLAVVICFNQSLKKSEIEKASAWINEAARKAVELGGTYYLPYQQVASTELFDSAYGHKIEAFREQKAKYDPNEVFYSGFYHKYLREAKPVKRLDYRALLETENWQAFEKFVGAVLKRLDVKKFKALLIDVLKHCKNEDDIYQELQRRLPEISDGPIADLKNGLSALSSINHELTEQAKDSLGARAQQPFNGYLEIGYPGRYIKSFKKAFKIEGKTYALCHGQSPMDYIEAGFPRPYDEFLELDDLDPAKSLKQLPDNSLELVSCFYGLHHFPEAKVDEFLIELRRVLKPEGRLLLDDHNIKDEQSWLIAQAAHTMVNLIGNEPLSVEQEELRHFKPMSEWAEKLQQFNLAPSDLSTLKVRDNDASNNAMLLAKNDKSPAHTTLATLMSRYGKFEKASTTAGNRSEETGLRRSNSMN